MRITACSSATFSVMVILFWSLGYILQSKLQSKPKSLAALKKKSVKNVSANPNSFRCVLQAYNPVSRPTNTYRLYSGVFSTILEMCGTTTLVFVAILVTVFAAPQKGSGLMNGIDRSFHLTFRYPWYSSTQANVTFLRLFMYIE